MFNCMVLLVFSCYRRFKEKINKLIIKKRGGVVMCLKTFLVSLQSKIELRHLFLYASFIIHFTYSLFQFLQNPH